MLNSPKVEDFIKLKEHPQAKYNDLSVFYYDALKQFAFMLSRDAPKKLLKGVTDLEKYSNLQGIIAFRKCNKLLTRQAQGKKSNKIDFDKRKYKHLHMWYFDALIEFLHGLSTNNHEKFKNEDHIKSAKKAITDLTQELENAK